MEGWDLADKDRRGIGYWIRRRAELFPEAWALSDADQDMTFGVFNRQVNRLAQAMRREGIRPGDRVAGLMLNSIPFLQTLFACAKLGAIFVPINFRLTAPEIRYILEDAGVSGILYHKVFAAAVEPACSAQVKQWPVGDLGSGLVNPFPPELIGDSEQEPELPIDPVSPHVMMYTSGTTGRPKGAMISHRNATWNAIQLMLHQAGLRPGDVILTVAPMFHIGGLGVHTLPAIYQGLPVVLLPRFDAQEVLAAVSQHRVTALFLVPAMWMAISQAPDFDSLDLTSLRVLISGGAPCPIPIIEFFQSRGLNFLEGFGMTETAPNSMILDSKDAVRKNGSIGLPLFHQEARVVAPDGRDVLPGEVGELVLRGPNIFEGYWNNPRATAAAFAGGWFHTEDLARQDDEGFFYLVDRQKDMLISGGENVYPVEVEQVLYRHPAVREVAVIGVPDARWGEVPLAVIALREGAQAPSLADLTAFCESQLARFKIPKHVVVTEGLPRNATGKVLKTVLRKQYGASGAGA
ncbi:MAG: long-chain fatty acid--CoA ligase [Thermaerobacter sp.]|nr:long-chain fatty acid--CoA ligase [Thermaerobacter sp.]